MNITREQIVVMLYRTAKFTGMDVSEGEDTIIKEYEDALTQCSGQSITASSTVSANRS